MSPAHIRSGLAFAFGSLMILAGGCNEAPPVPPNSSPGTPSNGVDEAGVGVFAPFVDAASFPSTFFPDTGPPGRPQAPHPTFGATVTASRPPPAISGGTLLVTRDGNTTIASDPDRDAIYVIDVSARAVTFTIALYPGDEPGRIVEDGSGRVHVALRSGGALVSIDPKSGTTLARRAVCPAPRGVAWDKASDLVWVACATGELVAFPSAGGAAAHSFVIERDLRDIIIQDGAIAVTKFRAAELLRIATDGTVARRDSLPDISVAVGPMFRGPAPPPAPTPTPSVVVPNVAWRAIAAPSGGILVVHQRESRSPIMTKEPDAYGASGPIVECGLTEVAGDGTASEREISGAAVLPVDVAIAPDGSYAGIVSAGAAFSATGKLAFSPIATSTTATSTTWVGAAQRAGLPPEAQPIALAFDTAGNLLVQSREPATLWIIPLASNGLSTQIVLSTISRNDTGHAIFHAQAGGLIACASCHPEGGDDGHVWLLDGAPRRTPSLRGTIAGTAPYHWPGDESDLNALTRDVYTGRMSGNALDAAQTSALTSWLETIPAPRMPSWVDRSAAARGRSLFEGSAGCARCHSGPKLTNNASMDVGTGGGTILLPDASGTLGQAADTRTFQVPPLVGVGWRTPLMHDGCAATIADRFGKCSTAGHGSIGQLSASNIADLGAYLESL